MDTDSSSQKGNRALNCGPNGYFLSFPCKNSLYVAVRHKAMLTSIYRTLGVLPLNPTTFLPAPPRWGSLGSIVLCFLSSCLHLPGIRMADTMLYTQFYAVIRLECRISYMLGTTLPTVLHPYLHSCFYFHFYILPHIYLFCVCAMCPCGNQRTMCKFQSSLPTMGSWVLNWCHLIW